MCCASLVSAQPLISTCSVWSTTISSAVLDAFKKHDLYVNVHTTKNPAGEIRGQLARG